MIAIHINFCRRPWFISHGRSTTTKLVFTLVAVIVVRSTPEPSVMRTPWRRVVSPVTHCLWQQSINTCRPCLIFRSPRTWHCLRGLVCALSFHRARRRSSSKRERCCLYDVIEGTRIIPRMRPIDALVAECPRGATWPSATEWLCFRSPCITRQEWFIQLWKPPTKWSTSPRRLHFIKTTARLRIYVLNISECVAQTSNDNNNINVRVNSEGL